MENRTGFLMVCGSCEGIARTAKTLESEGTPEPCIVVGEMPSLSLALRYRARIRGVVTHEQPGDLSHIIVLLRELRIPVLCVERTDDIEEGDYLCIEGEMVKKDSDHLNHALSNSILYAPKSAVLQDGHSVHLFATVWDNEGAKEAMTAGFSGIGLFRTEGLACAGLPTLTDQLQIYAETVELSQGRPLVFRLFDFSGDKSTASARDFEFIYRNQLTALLCAARGRTLKVLVPNVNYRAQITEIKKLCIRLQSELYERGVPCGNLQVGAMIETTMAAAISEDLCAVADFISIGLNGITRLSGDFPMFQERYNRTALLRMCKLVLDNASAAGKEVCVCGDLVCEEEMLRNLIGLGVRKISVSTRNAEPVAVFLQKESYREAQKTSLATMHGFFAPVRCC